MRITDVRIRQVTGTTQYPDDFWQERQRMPTDIYLESKARSGRELYRDWNLINDGEKQLGEGQSVSR